MKSEIGSFMKVWSSIFISLCYCYGISKVVPKGTIRLLMFLPVICSFLILPLNLNSFHLVTLTAFFATWLTSFKLLLLAFGHGPLSDPSLSLFHFAFVSIFPIVLQKKPTSPRFPLTKQEKPAKKTRDIENLKKSQNFSMHKIGQRSFWHFTKKIMFLLLLVCLGSYKDNIDSRILLLLICIYIYIGLDILLGVIAIIGQLTLRIELEPAFNDPYLSTSLQDFWSRRWNRVSSDALRTVVYGPIRNHLFKAVGKQWADNVALMCTFLVSSLMHEVLFYSLLRVRPGYGTTLFFFFHGVCMIVEGKLKKKIDSRWQLPQIIIGPLIFGFCMGSLSWLVLSDQLKLYKVDDRALEEYAAVGAFVKDLGLAWINWAITATAKISSNSNNQR